MPKLSDLQDFKVVSGPEAAPSGTPAPQASGAPKLSDLQDFKVISHAPDAPPGEQPFFGPGGKVPQFMQEHPHVGGVVSAVGSVAPVAGMMAGGTIGGMIGAGAGGVGAVPGGMAGAAIGGASGSGLKDSIDNALLGVPVSDTERTEHAVSAGLSGAAGEGIGRAAVPIVKAAVPVVGQLLTGIPASDISAYLSDSVNITQMLAKGGLDGAGKAFQLKAQDAIAKVRGEFQDPALQVIKDRVTPLSDVEAVSQVKDLLKQDIQTKYAGFPEAFAKINQVNQALPIADEARLGFTEELKADGLEKYPHSSDLYKEVVKHAENFNASNNGQQFNGAIEQVQSDLSQAYKQGDTKRIGVLSDVLDRATEFQQKQFKGLAARVTGGSASPQELQAFSQMAEQQGIPAGEDPTKYAKQVANDYLKSADKVSSDYSGFKAFLKDIQGQTGAKGFGASTTLKSLDSIPPDKLLRKMGSLDPETLGKIKSQSPEVYKVLSGVELRDMADSAMTHQGALDQFGKPVKELNLGKFIEKVNEMPKEARTLMFNADELKAFKAVSENPRLNRLNSLVDDLDKGIHMPGENADHIIRAARPGSAESKALGELSQLTGVNLLGDAQRYSAAAKLGTASPRTMVGRSGAAAAAGEIVGQAAGIPKVGAVTGALGGAATSPYALKKGIDLLNSPAAAPTLGQSLRGGFGSVKKLYDSAAGDEGGQ